MNIVALARHFGIGGDHVGRVVGAPTRPRAASRDRQRRSVPRCRASRSVVFIAGLARSARFVADIRYGQSLACLQASQDIVSATLKIQSVVECRSSRLRFVCFAVSFASFFCNFVLTEVIRECIAFMSIVSRNKSHFTRR